MILLDYQCNMSSPNGKKHAIEASGAFAMKKAEEAGVRYPWKLENKIMLDYVMQAL